MIVPSCFCAFGNLQLDDSELLFQRVFRYSLGVHPTMDLNVFVK